MLKFPNGSVFGISTAVSAAIAASAVSNAAPAVATVATGSIAEDDVLIISSAWSLLRNTVAQAGTITVGASDTVVLLGTDTTDTTLFKPSGGSVSLVKASDFVDFSQQGEPSTSGGEQQFWQGVFLEDPTGQQISVPTTKNAKVLTLPLHYDASLPWYAAAKKVDVKKQPVVLRCALPDGDVLYRYGYLSFDADPSIAANNPMGNVATFTALGASSLVEA